MRARVERRREVVPPCCGTGLGAARFGYTRFAARSLFLLSADTLAGEAVPADVDNEGESDTEEDAHEDGEDGCHGHCFAFALKGIGGAGCGCR